MDGTENIPRPGSHRRASFAEASKPVQKSVWGKKKFVVGGMLLVLAGCIALIASMAIFEHELPSAAGSPQPAPAFTVVNAQELKKWLDEGRALRLIDARSQAEFTAGHIPTAVNGHAEHFSSKAAEPREHGLAVVIYCAGPSVSGYSPCARAIEQALLNGPRQVYWFKGGMTAWQAQGYSVDRSS